MNEEEKKAIARIERLYKFSQDVNHTAVVLTEDTRCLGIVLNLLQQEKEKNKKLEEVIYIMAKDIANSDIDEDICKKYASISKHCADGDNESECIACVREYYFKKARGEENG